MSRWFASLSLCLVASVAIADGKTGTRTVIFTGESKVALPESWLSAEIRGQAVPLDSSEERRSRAIVTRAISLYPQSLLDQNLSSVFVVKELWFYGVKYGGTNSRTSIYIANRGTQQGFTDAFIASTFHHELSSILLRNHPERLDEAAWRDANRAGDQYRKSGTQSLLDGTAETRYSANFHVNGFLNQYGTSSVEEDFNTFAEALFSGDDRFWRAVDQFSRVEKKKDLIVAFYQSLDPLFTEEYFRAISRQ